jgi:ABC-type antimicrobial peptide transport system permease subunit
VLALIGGGLGVAAVVPLTRVVKGMLFAISPTDQAVLWSVVAVTVGAATAASYLPARRAANAEPIVSLRTQ